MPHGFTVDIVSKSLPAAPLPVAGAYFLQSSVKMRNARNSGARGGPCAAGALHQFQRHLSDLGGIPQANGSQA